MSRITRPGVPLFERLIIESHSLCNRSCWFCPRTFDQSGKYLDHEGKPVTRKLSTPIILDVMDQACAMGFTGEIGFHHYSEPLLDDRCIDLAREAKHRGLHPYIHTNGDVLSNNPDLCREVSEAFDRIVLGLYDYETNEELAICKKQWRARLTRANLQFNPIGPARDSLVQSAAVPRALVPRDPRMRLPDLVYAGAPCHRPLIRAIVQYDGEVCNCCEDTHGAFGLGNIHEEPLSDIWYSADHVDVVQNLLDGDRSAYSLCRSCPQSPTGKAPEGRRIRMKSRSSSGPGETFQ